MDDLISRQDLIDKINELMKSPWFLDGYVGLKDMAESKLNEFQIIDRLKWDERKNTVVIVRDFCVRGMPSAQVAHGWWEGDETCEDYDITGVKTWAVKRKCSACGFVHRFIEAHMCYAFCPSCGAKMDLEG